MNPEELAERRKEYRISHYLKVFKEGRKAGFDVALSEPYDETDEYNNNFKAVLQICEQYMDTYSLDYETVHPKIQAKVSGYYMIAIKIPFGAKIRINNTTYVQRKKDKDSDLNTDKIYFFKLAPEQDVSEISKTLEKLCFLCGSGINIILYCNVFYNIGGPKLEDTRIIDDDMIEALKVINEKVADYLASQTGDVKYFTTLRSPDLKKYRIGKNLLRNLSLEKDLPQKPKDLVERAKELGIKKVGVQLSLNEKRLLEAVLIFITNSTVVYSNVIPKDKEFKISVKELKQVVKERKLKENKTFTDTLNSLTSKTFIVEKSVKDTDAKICKITKLFEYRLEGDDIYIKPSSFVLNDILAIGDVGFYAIRETGSYSNKNVANNHRAFDYFFYRSVTKTADMLSVEMNISTLIERLGFSAYLKHEGKPKTYKKVNELLEIAKCEGYIKEYELLNLEKEKVKIEFYTSTPVTEK